MAAILCVDDESAVCALLDRILRDLGHAPILASGVTEAQQALSQQPIHLIIVDCVMPGRNGFELFDYVRDAGLDVPIVAMSGYSTAEHAEIAANRGAVDFLTKPLRLESVRIAVRSALALHRLRRLSEEARRELSALRGPTAVVGASEAIREVLEAVDIVAPTSNPVLLHGESGTGKSLFAREIHARSQRYDQPLVTVNCATLSEPLLAATLFGAASRGNASELGAFQRAAHGTIVLDEIADLRLHDQAKLVRVMQGHELEREGAHPIQVDARVIATTRHDLGIEVEAGRFHRELHQKLSGADVRTPPLRERLDDIPLLVAHFAEVNATLLAVKVPHVEPAALDYLRRRPWPGNVRELANAVERAMIQQPNAALTAEAFGRSHVADALDPSAFAGGAPGSLSISPSAAAASGDVLDLRTLERIAIYRALQKTGGHKTRAAELLGINERTLRNKLKAEPMPVWVSNTPADPPPGR